MSDFQEKFDAWCSGDQTEPFEWHSNVDAADAHVWAKNRQRRQPKPTLWQRFWRSPWTYLVFSIYWGFQVSRYHSWWATILYVTLMVLSFWDFFKYADRRWGRP